METKEKPAKEEEKEKEKEKEESYSSSDSVPIPEEFQKEVKELVDSCNSRECLDFLRSCIYRKEDELREAESGKKSKKNKLSTPAEFSKTDMPA